MEHPVCKHCLQKFTLFRKPRILPLCGHSFCEPCLAEGITRNGGFPFRCFEDGIVF